MWHVWDREGVDAYFRWGKTCQKQKTWKTQEHTGKMTLKMNLKEIRRIGLGQTDPAEDSDKWRALVNTAMNIMVS